MTSNDDPRPIIGIDVGGVIIDRINDGTDTSFFGPNYLATTAVPHAFEIIARLRQERLFKIYVVSKCGPETQKKTMKWLHHHNFFSITGVRPIDVLFCRERSDKAPICERLGITHFVDDRADVLWHMRDFVRNLYLFNSSEGELIRYARAQPFVLQVGSWLELAGLLLNASTAA